MQICQFLAVSSMLLPMENKCASFSEKLIWKWMSGEETSSILNYLRGNWNVILVKINTTASHDKYSEYIYFKKGYLVYIFPRLIHPATPEILTISTMFGILSNSLLKWAFDQSWSLRHELAASSAYQNIFSFDVHIKSTMFSRECEITATRKRKKNRVIEKAKIE